MRMPKDFVDAINAAVREVNPNAGTMTHGSMTLGSDFDEWLGLEAIKKYGFGPMPPDAEAAFWAAFNERRDELKASLVTSAVEVEKRRMAGEASMSFNEATAQYQNRSDLDGGAKGQDAANRGADRSGVGRYGPEPRS